MQKDKQNQNHSKVRPAGYFQDENNQSWQTQKYEYQDSHRKRHNRERARYWKKYLCQNLGNFEKRSLAKLQAPEIKNDPYSHQKLKKKSQILVKN